MHPSLYTDSPWYPPMYTQHNDYPPSEQQIDSSIGPTRVTRRQVSLKQGLLVRRVSLSINYMPPEDPISHSSHSQDATEPRPDSPLTDRQADHHLASPHVPPLQSPYQSNTPISPFEHLRRSRTRSTSQIEGRPQSPTLSTTSGVTSSSHTPTSPESSKISVSRPIVKEKHKKHRLRDVDRKSICIYHDSNPNARQEDIGAFFGVERSTISKILKEKDRWLNISEEDAHDQSTKHRPSKFPEVEEEMLNSLQEWSDNGVSITDQLIRQRALLIAKSFHITPDRFKGSSGWVENFKHRHDIRRGQWLRANRILPPDYAIQETHSSSVPPTPVVMAYDQRMHVQVSQPQSLRPSRSHEDQQHVHDRVSATPVHWPEVIHNNVSESSGPASAMIDSVLQAHGSLSPSESDRAPLQDIQHSPEIHHHQPQQLPQQQHDNHNFQQHQHHQENYYHHDHNLQHQLVVYSGYGQPLCGPGVAGPRCLEPTIAQAEEAISLLITFVDNAGRGIITDDERRKLTDIKCALLHAASGLPYNRSPE